MFRSRLSLDLSSPTSELPPPTTTPLQHNSNTSITRVNSPPFTSNIGTTGGSSSNLVLSPRYNEFKQYSSTFDALHALDVTNSNNNYHNSTSSVNKSRLYSTFSQDGGGAQEQLALHHSSSHLNNNDGGETILAGSTSLKRVSSVPSMSPAHSGRYDIRYINLQLFKTKIFPC